jgi:hypothetical protein
MFEQVTREMISNWFERGVQRGATHMLVVSDSFSYEYYPVYVEKGQDAHVIEAEINSESMQGVIEVYNLRLPKDPQLDESRARHY